MINIELSPKMLVFVIEALEFRINAYEQQIKNKAASDDEISDMSNDSQLLRVIKEDLESKKDW